MNPTSDKSGNQSKGTIRSWWADYPMTYADTHGDTTYKQSANVDLGTKEFFEHADNRFYEWNTPLHSTEGRFANIFDYSKYRNSRVLEVGCGMGCMSMNWALAGANIHAVDLNPVAVKQTKNRFKLFGLKGDIREADGEHLPFEDEEFEFVYSWGVLHHTPGTQNAIEEIWRVLKPGGEIGVMLYNRQSLLFRLLVKYQEGFVNMERVFLNDLELGSRYGDGDRQEGNPHTWPVTKKEIKSILFRKYDDVNVRVLGTDVKNVLNILYPELGSRILPTAAIKALARRWGWSLWITARKGSR